MCWVAWDKLSRKHEPAGDLYIRQNAMVNGNPPVAQEHSSQWLPLEIGYLMLNTDASYWLCSKEP